MGGEPDLQNFAEEKGVGERGINKLRQNLYGHFTGYSMACKVFGQAAVDASRAGRTASLRQAWMGWGPSQKDISRKVAGWDWDKDLEAYTAQQPGRFACSCGNELTMPGYRNCHCGKIWNGYVIGTGGTNHAAAAEKYLVREVPMRPDVIVANKQEALLPPRQAADEAGDDDFPSHHIPSTPKTPKTPADWAHRDNKNNWTAHPLPRRTSPQTQPAQV